MPLPLSYLTVEEYLKAEESSFLRHEYLGGQVFAMAGASEEHNLIAGNIYALLRPHLRGTDCRAFVSDMKDKIQVKNVDIFYYPDVLVTCDRQDRERYFKTRPSLIIEVLTDSTATTDKREKRLNYQTLDTLQEYILISQDKIQVEVYRQDIQGNWSMQTLGKDDILKLESVGLKLTMAEIYEDVIKLD